MTDADLAFTIDGKRIDEMDALMDTPEFESLLREIMLSRFWGVSLVECLFIDGFSFNSIPRKHIRTKTKEVAIREEDEHGIPYADNDLIIQFGGDDDLGILLRAAPFVIYKRGASATGRSLSSFSVCPSVSGNTAAWTNRAAGR